MLLAINQLDSIHCVNREIAMYADLKGIYGVHILDTDDMVVETISGAELLDLLLSNTISVKNIVVDDYDCFFTEEYYIFNDFITVCSGDGNFKYTRKGNKVEIHGVAYKLSVSFISGSVALLLNDNLVAIRRLYLGKKVDIDCVVEYAYKLGSNYLVHTAVRFNVSYYHIVFVFSGNGVLLDCFPLEYQDGVFDFKGDACKAFGKYKVKYRSMFKENY